MYARLGEIVSLDGSIAVTLAAHQAIGLKVKCVQFLADAQDLLESHVALRPEACSPSPRREWVLWT